ncbi:MAG: NAD(+)/NADH kinase [Thermoplasmatota archaeon]
MKIGLVAHPKKKRALRVAKEIISHIEKKKVEGKDVSIVLDEVMSNNLKNNKIPSQKIEDMKVKMILCVGGDGTLLRTLQKTNLPVLGINVGSLGFLMEVPPEDFPTVFEQITSGNFVIEERSRLKTLLNNEELPDATNEAVIATSIPSKIQEFEFYIDMEWAQRVRADGMIISTPTGSTSYALSAGGSVMDPRLNAFEIIPISPFRINSRPFIIPDQSTISLRITHKTRSAQLVIDGAMRRTIRYKDQLLFTRSKTNTKFVRFDTNFYRKFQEKIAKERPPMSKKGKY